MYSNLTKQKCIFGIVMKIAIINGPNLNLLGKRETNVYGQASFDTFLEKLTAKYPNIEFYYYQSNLEGDLINKIQECDTNFKAIILNAGGYTHTSVAIADAVGSISTPVIEVHISNIFAREEYRHVSIVGAKCIGNISGFGLSGYELAVEAILRFN